MEEILASGLPGVRGLTGRARRLQQGYVERIVDRDVPDEAGANIRNPAALRRWMAAYAAASSTTATFETIRDAASGGGARKASKTVTRTYRDALARVWVLDDVAPWIPSNNRLRELGRSPKHQLVEPALAAQLLGVQRETLLAGQSGGPDVPRDGTLLGALFESLATQSVRVYAERAEARVRHLRTARGRQEIDLVVERPDGSIVGMEVKLTQTVGSDDVKHLVGCSTHSAIASSTLSCSRQAGWRTGARTVSPSSRSRFWGRERKGPGSARTARRCLDPPLPIASGEVGEPAELPVVQVSTASGTVCR